MPPDGTDSFTPMSPSDWKASLLAKKGTITGGGFKAMSPKEWKASYQSKKSAAVPDASKMTQAQAVQQFEGGGLQAPTIDPIDILTFGVAGGAMGAVKGPAEAGLEALKEAGTVGAAEVWNKATAPIVQRTIPGQSPAAQMGRNLAQTAAGFVPFAIAGAGPEAVKAAGQRVGGAGEIAEQGVKVGEKAATDTESAQSAMDTAKAKADKELDTKYDKFRQQQIPSAKDQAQAESVQSALGRTPEQTRSAAAAPPAEFAQRQADLRSTILDTKNKVENEFHDEYEKTFGKYNDRPMSPTITAQKAQQLEDWAQKNNIALDAPTRKLLDEAKRLGAGKGTFNPSDYGYTAKQWSQASPEMKAQVMDMASKMTAEGPPRVGAPTTGTTVAQVRGLNTKFGELAGSHGPEGYVARQMRDSIMADLDNSGVPGAKELNNRYRVFRGGAGLGDYDFLGKVSDPKGGDITNIMGEIFKNPQRLNEFTKHLSSEQKPLIREAYGDYVHNGGAVDADVLKQLGFQGPLTKPDAWVYLDKAEQKLGDVFETAPMARKKFLSSLEQQRAELLHDTSQDIVDEARRQAKGLGTTGDRIMAKINAAKTPEEQAKIALQEFGELNPSQEAQAAGVNAIQNSSMKTGGLMGRMKYRAQMYAILALSGRPFYMKLAALLGTGTALNEMLRASVRSSLRDPVAATKLYRAYIEPGVAGFVDTITRNVIMGAMPAEAAQVGQAATAKPGPMVQHIEHEKAKNIAGPRGAASPERVSRIEDLNKDIAAGSAPEVNADLRGGKLTHTDIAKMVQPDKPGLASLFQGMSPQQAVDAFAMADPSERELALPALAQHLQNEGKNLNPQQRQVMLAQLRTVLQPPQQENVG